MDEEAFRAFYDRTSRRALGATSRGCRGDRQVADDLLQESYYRFLRARVHSRAKRTGATTCTASRRTSSGRGAAHGADHAPAVRLRSPRWRTSRADAARTRGTRRTDLRRAIGRLKPRERALLWLAYAQGPRTAKSLTSLGLKTGSIKLLLFRARRKLAACCSDQRAGATSGNRS